MRNKSLIFVSIIIIVICFFGISTVLSNSDIKVDTFNANITLDENGDMHVEETWIVNYPPGKSVAFRDIGYRKYNADNPLYQDVRNTSAFNENNASVTVYGSNGQALNSSEYRVGYSFNNDDKDELGYPIECYPKQASCESIFVQVHRGMQREMTFKYTYSIIGAVTSYLDTSELNWRLLDYFESGIKSSTVTINIPNSPKSSLLAWGHGLSRGNIIIDDNKVTLEMEKIKSGEFLEFRILMDHTNFNVPDNNSINRAMKTEIITYEETLAEQTNLRILIAEIILYGTIGMIILMGFITYKAYHKYDKEHEPRFTGKYYRELPATYSPAVMSYLYYFRKINDEDLTATLLDLIRRGYLHLDANNQGINDKNPDFKIISNPQDTSNLQPHEQHLINWFINIIGNKSEVTLKEIENYPKASYTKAQNFQQQASLFVRRAKAAGEKFDFFEKTTSNAKGGLFAAAIIPIIYILISLGTQAIFEISNVTAMIISLVVLIIYVAYISSIDKRSVNGNEDYTKWKAFKDFMLDFGNIKDYPIPGIVVWEHYLVYATSLKIADKVMQQLEVRLPNIKEEAMAHSTYMGFGYRYYGFHFGYTLGRINNTITTAKINGNATISAHHASRAGGGGRGGGFSGGSSFGGGGGGFRGR